MLRLLAACVLFTCSGMAGGLDRYRSLVVEDAPGQKRGEGVRVTYLGTNGYQLETGGKVLLVDPYFTRAPLGRVALGLPLRSDPQRVGAVLPQLQRKADVVVVTHGHFDHALDLPAVMEATGARLLASETTIKLATLAGAPAQRMRAISVGQRVTVGAWKITALQARHDCICGWEPFPGEARHEHVPRTAGDWKMGTPLAFLIEGGGQRIYVDSGGRPDGPVPRLGRVDLAIAGVALGDSRERLPALWQSLRPRYFLPSHQDDFFRPLDRPFRFGQLTRFSTVLEMHRREKDAGRLVLLDYFRPWTLR